MCVCVYIWFMCVWCVYVCVCVCGVVCVVCVVCVWFVCVWFVYVCVCVCVISRKVKLMPFNFFVMFVLSYKPGLLMGRISDWPEMSHRVKAFVHHQFKAEL